MSNFLYVDNSNVWIEGMHVAAVAHGYAPTLWDACEHKICDYSWRIDFGRLIEFAGGKPDEIGRAVLYGSKPPANDSLWAAAKKHGFEVVVHERSAFTGKEKKLDTNIVTDVTAGCRIRRVCVCGFRLNFLHRVAETGKAPASLLVLLVGSQTQVRISGWLMYDSEAGGSLVRSLFLRAGHEVRARFSLTQ